MKTYAVTIEGTADLLMNALGVETAAGLEEASKKATVAKDWTGEWANKIYCLNDGTVYQPEAHLLGCLVKAAASEKIPGRRGKTYKDPVKAGCFIEPACIPHLVTAADFQAANVITGPATAETGPVYIDRRPVRVQRAMVMRYRPALTKGWRLSFEVQLLDDDFQGSALKAILDRAGREVGIGDFRPRFGRFHVVRFEQVGD
jgi:hypothetical protein